MTRDELRALVAEMSEMDLVEIRRLALHEQRRREATRAAVRSRRAWWRICPNCAACAVGASR